MTLKILILDTVGNLKLMTVRGHSWTEKNCRPIDYFSKVLKGSLFYLFFTISKTKTCFANPHFTSPHFTSPRFTSPRFTSSPFTSPLIVSLIQSHLFYNMCLKKHEMDCFNSLRQQNKARTWLAQNYGKIMLGFAFAIFAMLGFAFAESF